MAEAPSERADAGDLTEAERRQAKRVRKGRIPAAEAADATEDTQAANGELTEAERKRAKRVRKGRIPAAEAAGASERTRVPAERKRAKRERKGRLGTPSAAGERAAREGSAQGSDGYVPLIAFVHIPKTAGGTVKGMFFNAYSKAGMRNAGNYFGKDTDKGGRKLQRGNWQNWIRNGGRVTIGHTPYGLYRVHLPADTRYVTFLREPIARVRSHYNRHLRAQRPTPTGATLDELKKFDTVEQALVEMHEPRINNLMTRLLCTDPAPVGRLPASALDDAKANLRDFFFVGMVDRFDESVALLQRRLGLEAVPCGPRRHVNRHSPPLELTDRESALIEEHNQFDIELYAFAQELYEEALARDGKDMADEVDALRKLNAAADEEANRATMEACEWLERELPPGTPREMGELAAAAEAAGIETDAYDSARRLLDLVKRPGPDGPSWVRSAVTDEDARDWLARELPAGAARPVSELRAGGLGQGIDKKILGRAAQMLRVKEETGPNGDCWVRPGEDEAAAAAD